MKKRVIGISVLLVACSLFLAAPPAIAEYPAKEVRIIVNYGVGGGVDRTARSIQRFLPEALGASVLVENHKGAGGKIGYKYFLKQPKDNYNILCAFIPALTNVEAKNPGLFKVADLAYINVQWSDPGLLVAHKDAPFDTLEEFIEAAKREPNKYSFSVAGKGAVGYLLSNLMFKKLGLKINMVPYPSGGKARAAIQGGHVQLTSGGAGGMLTVKEVTKPLGLFWDKPIASWPNAKPVNETLKKYGIKMPVGAAYRFFAVHAEAKRKYPEDFKALVEAFRKTTTENTKFIEFCDKARVDRNWFGPEKTTQILTGADKAFQEIIKGK